MYVQNKNSIKIIGIVGGKGKTIIGQWMIYLFEKHGLKIANISSKGIYIGQEKVEKKSNVLDEMIKRKVDILIIEINDTSLYELGVHFYFDTIVYAHMNENHLKEKLDLHEKILNRLHESSIIIWNADDQKNIDILRNIKNKMIVTYGFSSKATVTASSIDIVPFVKFQCCIQRGLTTYDHMEIDPMEFPIEVKILEEHNICNILAAVIGALMYGILPKDICKYLNLLKEKN